MAVKSLAIDDMKELGCDYTAKNAKDGIEALHTYRNTLKSLYLDYDLGAGKDGYYVALYAAENGLLPFHVKIVTMNPVGRKRIESVLIQEGYWTHDGCDYYRKKR